LWQDKTGLRPIAFAARRSDGSTNKDDRMIGVALRRVACVTCLLNKPERRRCEIKVIERKGLFGNKLNAACVSAWLAIVNRLSVQEENRQTGAGARRKNR
jgi:hypothetical protein